MGAARKQLAISQARKSEVRTHAGIRARRERLIAFVASRTGPVDMARIVAHMSDVDAELVDGERRDGCRHEGECLGRFLATARRPSASAHCPTGCTQYAPIERHERVGASMLGGISSLGMAQELIAETGDDE